MKLTANSHTHTTWCDGLDTPAEMAGAAFRLGFTALGFSGHSPAPFDPTCPGISNEAAYRAEIAELKQQYAGRMNILCGVEQDYYAPVNRADYDYLIGSVHYLPNAAGQYVAVDGTVEHLTSVKNDIFGGNGLAMAEAFYAASYANVKKYKPDIVGHYDLIVKHNTGNLFFEEEAPAYKNAALEALDAIIDEIKPYGGMIELNTRGVCRGYRKEFYPAPFLLRHMAQRGARVTISSDCHNKNYLDFGFEKALENLRAAGYQQMAVQGANGFGDIAI
ncbi:MAG: histidinol-phosphatase [Oscillospiraceae bacterium]